MMRMLWRSVDLSLCNEYTLCLRLLTGFSLCALAAVLYVNNLCSIICASLISLPFCETVKSQAWGRTSGGAGAGIRFLSDDSGTLTKSLGLIKETPVGIRTKRFSLITDDGVVTNYFSSSEQSSDTWAPNVLSAL